MVDSRLNAVAYIYLRLHQCNSFLSIQLLSTLLELHWQMDTIEELFPLRTTPFLSRRYAESFN